MARILGIGIATLDIINSVDDYPTEDSEIRAVGQQLARGGNATNTLVVLSRLGHDTAWGGTLAQDYAALLIEQDLRRHGVDMQYCRRLDNGRTPTSCILRSTRNGSRSIVHYRDLPEYAYADFEKIPLAAFDWLHVEGRDIAQLTLMLEHVRQTAPALPVSIEIEKPREQIAQLYQYGNLLLFSRHYARHCGFAEAGAFLRHMQSATCGQLLICAWGDAGAYALQDGQLHHGPAVAPPRLIDTLGAGDTFNAAVIDAQLHGLAIDATLAAACRLAGAKCAQAGFDHLQPPMMHPGQHP
jgi:ketohexokinase